MLETKDVDLIIGNDFFDDIKAQIEPKMAPNMELNFIFHKLLLYQGL